MKVTLILTCAGKGERAGFNKNKLLVKFCGSNVIERAVLPFIKSGLINQYIITASETDLKEIEKTFPFATVVEGGKTRSESVKNALLKAEGEIVIIHDGARPFVTTQIIKNCIESAVKTGSGITAVSSKDTVATENGYLGKEGIKIIQTPQAFKKEEIVKAYSLAGNKTYNDDGEIYNEFIRPITFVEGSYDNVKLTYKEDFSLLNSFGEIRYGVGFDCHKLVENRKLILGGVEIPHGKGLLGHSDADVLTHAIMDAILSSLSLRDIGFWFPDKDEKYKDACSTDLLKEVLRKIKEKGYKVKSVSAVIMAEKPKLLNYIPLITDNLAKALDLSPENIGIGATTLEGLGFVGREEGICVNASAVTEEII